MRPHLVDATLFYSPTGGGVRRYLLAKHHWLTSHGGVRHTLLVPGSRDSCDAGRGFAEFASPRLVAGYRMPLRLRALRRRLCELAPDLLEAGDPYQVGWQVARVAEATGIPAVAFCHSDLIALANGRIGPHGARAAAIYLRRLYLHFQMVIAPSRTVADRLVAAGIDGVHVLPLGVDPQVFSPTRRDPDLRASLGLPATTRLLVFAGRLAPEKNIPDLHEMGRRLGAPYHLLVVGGTQRRRTSAQVTMLPYETDPVALARLLASCDALVHAGLQETFGLVAIEAMACALPVICYAGGALAELVDDDVGTCAQPASPAALADAVAATFARDPVALGRAARMRAIATYSWDAVFRRQLRLYRVALGHRVRGAPDLALHAPRLAP